MKSEFRFTSRKFYLQIACFWVALLIICIQGWGCAKLPNNQYIEVNEAIPTSRAAPTATFLINTVTNLPSNHVSTPEPTRTLTAILSSTPGPTASNSVTPLPSATLSIEEVHRNLHQLLMTNQGCRYPCWWGVELNKSSVEDIYALSKITGKEPSLYVGRNGISHYGYVFDLPLTNFNQIFVTYSVENHTVISSTIYWPNPSGQWNDFNDALQRFLITNVLLDYGLPNQVWLVVQPRVEQHDPRWFTLWLIYDDLEFSVRYEGNVANEDPLTVCLNNPQETQLISIHFYMGYALSHQALEEYRGIEPLVPLEDITNNTLEDFFKTFTTKDVDKCIVIMSD